MQNDVYDYTQPAGTGAVQKNTVLRKTYGLLGLSFIPCAIGAFLSSQTGINLYTMFGNRWIAFGVTLAFFYGMIMLIEKNRHSNTGAALLMVFTFGMGVLISPMLQYSLSISNGPQLVGVAAVMTAAVFFTMAAVARRTKADMNSLGRFLIVGVVVLMVGVVANMFLQIPALGLTISAGFVIFSSLLIMFQIRNIIDGGETSHVSAALTIFVSLYNIFSSLLHIITSLFGEE